MLIAGLDLIVLGLSAVLGGRLGMRMFSDSAGEPPETFSGGAYLGGVWAYRLGVGVAIIGGLLLGVAGLMELVG